MKKLIAILLVPIFLTLSCDKYLDCEGCKENPSNPTVSTADNFLAISLVSTYSTYSGNLGRITAMWMQHQAGADFQYQEFEVYNMVDGDLNNEWNQIYADGLVNMKQLLADFGEGNPYYRGITKVLMAMNFGIASSLWGDIPVSNALQGLENINPAYDAQQVVYDDIQNLLTDAITDLKSTPESNILFPGSEDFSFGGDPDSWIRVAYVLKARYANHLSKKDAGGSATATLAHLDNAFTAGLSSTDDDLNAVFGTAGNEKNQWNAFLSERGDYMKMGKFFVDMLIAKNDPRLPFYAIPSDTAGNYTGSAVGDFDKTVSDIGPYFASVSSPAPLVTFVEAKFIEAEAALRSGDAGRAATAHNDAVMTHVELVTGAPDAAYYAAEASETAGSITMEKIMTQKYIAMFTQAETWADWRRTGFPAISPPSNATTPTGVIPRSMLTTLDERTNNNQATVNSNLETKVWWDQ